MSGELVERVARALVPLLYGSQEDEWGNDLPDKQFDDLPADWQARHLEYATAALEASGIVQAREALERIEGQAVCVAISNASELPDMLVDIADIARQALSALDKQ